MTYVLIGLLFVVVGFAAYQLAEARRWRQTSQETRAQQETLRTELEQAQRVAIEKGAESLRNLELAEVQVKLLTQTQQQIEDRFKALAADTLQTNSQLFLDRSRDQIQHLVEPVNQSLRRFEEQVQAVERSRVGAYEGITAQVRALTDLQERVRQSTDQLKTALRSPSQRGRWGEMQLRRVVEAAGMVDYCDFIEQKTLFGEANQRPDLIVRLPNQCEVVVDAKVSLEAYLRSVEAQTDAERQQALKEHAAQVKTHIRSLSEKAYWQRLPCSPEFVVAFLPLESLFSAALEQDPALLDFFAEKRVVIATPVTLITLLLTVAHGWRQRTLAENIDKIRDTGIELYTRLSKMNDHFVKLGDAIERTVETYNQTVGSMERNVLSSARKFHELRPASAEEMKEAAEVEVTPRRLDPGKWPALTSSASQ
ncbi:MAG TPA: DNA recombination protein RmuC [Bryobacteraceae bacterium]|jgi:DNA recombination protein RmuC|nr:DNA recombination protein RmuC [Bryobacteraceae bacterium]